MWKSTIDIYSLLVQFPLFISLGFPGFPGIPYQVLINSPPWHFPSFIPQKDRIILSPWHCFIQELEFLLKYFCPLVFFSVSTLPPSLHPVTLALLKHSANNHQLSFLLQPWALSGQDHFHSDCFLWFFKKSWLNNKNQASQGQLEPLNSRTVSCASGRRKCAKNKSRSSVYSCQHYKANTLTI